MKNMKRKGFTLIELIVVMAVIGILVLLAAPKFLGYTKDANVTAMQSDAKILSNAALMYNIDEEEFPVVNVEAVDTSLLDVNDVDKDDNKTETLKQAYQDILAKATTNTDLIDYLVKHGFDNETTETTEVDTIALLDVANLKDYVKNIKGEYTDYIIVTSGALEGEVFHIAGVPNKEGNPQFGIVINK